MMAEWLILIDAVKSLLLVPNLSYLICRQIWTMTYHKMFASKANKSKFERLERMVAWGAINLAQRDKTNEGDSRKSCYSKFLMPTPFFLPSESLGSWDSINERKLKLVKLFLCSCGKNNTSLQKKKRGEGNEKNHFFFFKRRKEKEKTSGASRSTFCHYPRSRGLMSQFTDCFDVE